MHKRDTFKLGLTVIVLFLLFVFAVIFIGGDQLLESEQDRVRVRFRAGHSLPELTHGSFVTYFGQKIGTVVDARIVEDVDPDDPHASPRHFLEVQASLSQAVDLREDCVIKASGPPLGGGGMLQILARGRSAVPADPDRPIYGVVAGFQAILDRLDFELDENQPAGLLSRIKLQLNASDPESLIAHVHAAVDDVNVITATLRRELDRAQQDVLLAKLHGALDRLNDGLGQLTGMLEDNRPRVDRTLSAIEQASTTFDQRIVAVLAEELELPESPQGTLLSKIHEAMDCLNESLGNVQVASGGVKETVVLNKQHIGEIIDNASAASVSLKEAIRDLSLHPWKLFKKPTDAERRDLNIVYVARAFSDAAAHLDHSSLRLQALLETYEGGIASDDPELNQIREQLGEVLRDFRRTEQALWTQLNKE